MTWNDSFQTQITNVSNGTFQFRNQIPFQLLQVVLGSHESLHNAMLFTAFHYNSLHLSMLFYTILIQFHAKLFVNQNRIQHSTIFMYNNTYLVSNNIKCKHKVGSFTWKFQHLCPTLQTAQFYFTRHSLDLSDNVLHDWLFSTSL